MASSKDKQPITVKDLAADLGIEPKDLRVWLRGEGKGQGRGKRYEFTTKEAAALKRKFAAAQKAEKDGGDEG